MLTFFSWTVSKESYDHRFDNERLQSTLRRLALDDLCERDFRGGWLNVVAKRICDHNLARTIRSQLHNRCYSRSHRSEETVSVLSNLHGHWIGVNGIAQHIQRAFDRIRIHSYRCIFIHHFRRILWHIAIALCASCRNNAKEGEALVILECGTHRLNAKSIFRYKMLPILHVWRCCGGWRRWYCKYTQRCPQR